MNFQGWYHCMGNDETTKGYDKIVKILRGQDDN